MMESWYSRPALRRGGAMDGHGGHAPRVRGLAPVIFSSVPIRFQGRSYADNMLRLLCAKTKEAFLSSAVHTVVQTVLSQSSIFGQNPKIGCQEFNGLQAP